MTAGGMVDTATLRRLPRSAADDDPWIVAWARTLTPADGWVALSLLVLNLIVVVLSVERSDWVPTPSLVGLLLIAMLMALALYRLPLWPAISLPLGIAAGVGIITWQMAGFELDGQPLGGAGELWGRLELWLSAARTGSINIDQVPFGFGLMLATWLTGFLAAWSFLRHRNFWGVFILGGIGLFSNLTFLPPSIAFHLGMYLFTALLLVARVQAVRRQDEWRRRSVSYDSNLASLTSSDSFFLTIGVLFVAFLLPTGGLLPAANGGYESMRSPLQSFEDDFNRLFAGLPARREIGFRLWDDVMAFQGTIKPTTNQVLAVESPVPMYWKARTYGTYTGKGWISTETAYQPMDYSPEFTSGAAEQERQEAEYLVTPFYDSEIVFSGYRVVGVGNDVEIETQITPLYEIDLSGPNSLLPLSPVVASTVQPLHGYVVQRGGAVEDADLDGLLPPDFNIVEVQRQDGLVIGATLAEALPLPPDVLSVRRKKGRFESGEQYRVTSAVSLAEPDELRNSGAAYPIFILEHYTQLPSTLPQRVRDLAVELTEDEPTPYDKAIAVENYLGRIPYNLEIDPPPFDADGVDHFLFSQGQGYSEYFASSMSVLLRSVGVPARVAVGYTTGDESPEGGVYWVADSHSHAWVEVYMPGHGWIPFEPTPGESLPVFGGGQEEDSQSNSATADITGVLQPECFDEFTNCPGDNPPESDILDGDAPGNFGDTLSRIWPWLVVALVGVSASVIVARSFWTRYLAVPAGPKRAFQRLASLARLASLGPSEHQTPYQFGAALGQSVPAADGPVSVVVESYVRHRYGNKKLSSEEQRRLSSAWLQLRYPLLRRIFRRRG